MRLGLGISIPGTSGLVQAAFSPLDLSPILWLDAADTSTITESGGAVSQWDDKSGNGNDLVQATAANQPTTGTTTINGLNVISLDGNDRMESPSVSLTGATMIAVVEHTTESFILLASNGSPIGFAGAGASGSADTILVSSMGTMTLHFNASLFSGTTRNQLYNELAGSTKIVRLQLTGSFSGGLIPFSYVTDAYSPVGNIAEVIVVDGTLTAGEISDCESYLADKWGITL